jgi:hypothetical protein
MFSDVSYIMQYRERSVVRDRTRNLFQVISHLRKISKEIEILVLHQDYNIDEEASVFLEENKCRYVLLKNPGLFNRSWGFNCSVELTSRNKLVFADNDMIIDKPVLIESIKLLEGYSAVRPYNGFSIDLTEQETIEYIKTSQHASGSMRNINNFSGGVVMFNREDFINIGMFDERFEGWGGEDDEMSIHLKRFEYHGMIKTISHGGPVIHLYHGRSDINDGPTHNNYNKNVSYITDNNRNSGILKLGDVNRYV